MNEFKDGDVVEFITIHGISIGKVSYEPDAIKYDEYLVIKYGGGRYYRRANELRYIGPAEVIGFVDI